MYLFTNIFIYFIYLYICRGRGCHRMSANELELPSFSPQTVMVYLSSSFASSSILRDIASYAFLASFFQVLYHGTYEKSSERLPWESTGSNKRIIQTRISDALWFKLHTNSVIGAWIRFLSRFNLIC